MNLYEIDRSIEEVLTNLVDDETGEVNEDKLDELNQLNMDRENKIENCVLYAKSLKAEAEAIMAESKALADRASRKLNRAENILQYVDSSLCGEPFETARCTVTYRPSQTVEIVNLDAIPDELCNFETKKKPSKADIKKLLRSGKAVTGAILVDHKRMQVK